MPNGNEWLDADTPHDKEVRYLVEHSDLSPQQAKELVARHGPDREKLLQVARTMKAEG